MINYSQIKSGFSGLVGWRQPINPDYDIVDASHLLSSSGMYFQDISNYVSIENIKNVQRDITISDAQFNTRLTEITDAALIKIINSIFLNDDIIDNRMLFDNAYDWKHVIENDSSFVGYELKVANSKELLNIINNIYTSFDGVGSVKLLLFHSAKNGLVDSKTITTTENTESTTSLDWRLPFSGTLSGGTYYIGYLTDGLSIKAYNRDYDNANVKNCFSGVGISPIKVLGWNQETLFDINEIEYTSETYGLNFDITTARDYTDLILKNKYRFINAYMLQVAVDVLEMILHSTRSNGIEQINKANVLYELNGNLNNPDLPRSFGIAGKLKNEIKMLEESFFNLDQLQILTAR